MSDRLGVVEEAVGVVATLDVGEPEHVRPVVGRPPVREIGIGDVVDARLERNVRIIGQANNLPRLPAPSEVFNRNFLPPSAERPKQM